MISNNQKNLKDLNVSTAVDIQYIICDLSIHAEISHSDIVAQLFHSDIEVHPLDTDSFDNRSGCAWFGNKFIKAETICSRTKCV